MKTILKFILIILLAIPAMHAKAQTPPPFPTRTKTLNITVFLQGFYNVSNGAMNKTKDYVAGNTVDKWAGTIVDTITVELHDATTYATKVYTAYGVQLNQNGSASINIVNPNAYIGSYYITIKARDHIETTTATPVSFAASIISYNFSDAATKVFGNNSKLLGNIYCIFAGDLNKDGFVNLTDLSAVNFSALQQATGYVNTDINGDGLVNLTDLSAVNFAALQQLAKHTP